MGIQISELFVYPGKGFQGTSLDVMDVTATGPLHDRQLMLIDENNQFMSQRQHPAIATLGISIQENQCHLSIPNLPPLVFAEDTSNPLEATIWKDTVNVVEWSQQASQALSKFLGESCRLVGMAPNSKRELPPKYATGFSQVQFADGFPFLLISQASLDDLNSRLDVPVPMNRFRPNVVVTGCEPYEEDQWEAIKIGDIRFDLPKPCSRCTVTTVNQDTGQVVKERGKNPLKALARYRNTAKGIMFGQNMVHHSTGVLKVGQAVEIVKRGDGPVFG